MFYLAIEWGAGGYRIAGEGLDEADALRNLNDAAEGFPTPPPVFASVQDIRKRFCTHGSKLTAYVATEVKAEYRAFLAELDCPLGEKWERPDNVKLGQWEVYGMLAVLVDRIEGDNAYAHGMAVESVTNAIATDGDSDLEFEHGECAMGAALNRERER